MQPTDRDPKDIDQKLSAESKRLLGEMTRQIERGRLLLRDRQRALVAAERLHASAGTLGAVLYARPAQDLPGEREWVSLVRSIAARDQRALDALYERGSGPVTTLIERIVSERATAERLTLHVFADIWRQADRYDAAQRPVLAWIMNLARARAIAGARPDEPLPVKARLPATPQWKEPEWQEVARGITVKMLAADAERHMVSMLVRLVPGGEYPAHTHAGVEELHLLEGELWIDDHKLYAGDYNRAEPGTGDKRVWSETGCACVLVTSTRDILR